MGAGLRVGSSLAPPDRYSPAVIFNKYPTHNYTVFATTVTPLLSHLCVPPATVVLLNVRVKGQTTSPIGMLVVASGIRLWNTGLARAADVSQLSDVVGLPTQRNPAISVSVNASPPHVPKSMILCRFIWEQDSEVTSSGYRSK